MSPQNGDVTLCSLGSSLNCWAASHPQAPFIGTLLFTGQMPSDLPHCQQRGEVDTTITSLQCSDDGPVAPRGEEHTVQGHTAGK